MRGRGRALVCAVGVACLCLLVCVGIAVAAERSGLMADSPAERPLGSLFIEALSGYATMLAAAGFGLLPVLYMFSVREPQSVHVRVPPAILAGAVSGLVVRHLLPVLILLPATLMHWPAVMVPAWLVLTGAGLLFGLFGLQHFESLPELPVPERWALALSSVLALGLVAALSAPLRFRPLGGSTAFSLGLTWGLWLPVLFALLSVYFIHRCAR